MKKATPMGRELTSLEPNELYEGVPEIRPPGLMANDETDEEL